VSKTKFRQVGKIPEGWATGTLKNIAIFRNGKSSPVRNESYMYNVFGSNGIIGQSKSVNSERDTIIIGRVGSYCGSMYYSANPCWVTDNAIISKSKNNNNPQFLYYLLVNLKLNKYRTGSGQPLLNQKNLNSIEIPYPKYKEQKAISKILSALDEKIELNQKMNKTLEAIAQAIFKHWFVDFKFPGYEKVKFINGMPEDWRKGKLIDVCDILMGQSPPGDTYNETGDGIIFYQGNRDFGYRFPTPRVYCTSPTRIAEDGNILISVRAPVGALNITLEKCAIGRGVAALKMKKYSNGFIFYFLLTQQNLWDQFNSEGTVFGCLNKKDFHKVVLNIPSDKVMRQFDMVVKSIEKMIQKNELETRTLENIRDSVLPKLMSGKIGV